MDVKKKLLEIYMYLTVVIYNTFVVPNIGYNHINRTLLYECKNMRLFFNKERITYGYM